jgi:putative aldouronate transport system substrate-binding protein
VFGVTAIKKAAPDRIKELLRIMNYLAAPIGSEEYLLLHYGIQGTDYDLDAQGNPVSTAKGQADAMPWGAVTVTVPTPPLIVYNPQDPEMVRVINGDQQVMAAVGKSDPSVGLYSNASVAKSAVLNQAITDGLTEIVKGTQPVSALDQLVKDWRANGGDQMRAEYEQAFAAANS